jgi:hypothetical protein
LQALGGVGVEGAGLFQRGFHAAARLRRWHVRLAARRATPGLLALFVEGRERVLQLLQALHARLLLVAQFVQLGLPGLLFFLFVLALFQLQALGNLLVEGEEGIGRVVVEGLERFLWQYAGQVVQALLQQLLIVGQGLVLLLQMALGLLLGVVGRLQLLVQAGGVFCRPAGRSGVSRPG